MAAMAGLVPMMRGSGKLCYVFAGLRQNSCASGAVTSWKRECSSQSPQVSSKADMPRRIGYATLDNANACNWRCQKIIDAVVLEDSVGKLLKPVPMENPYKEPPKKCILCGITLDYKNVQLLSQFISPYTGQIFGRHITGLCEKKQFELSKTIRRARKTGFMSVTYKDPTFLSDPKICNIKYPE